ncbi:major royal jelly family protein [Candidatus Kirkpatrickella diaphorinae]|uniref:Major royal jelly family protein n=1 Tax=Candidatus Kirkpatrickella diaphorinae TaxID=2984322 RepID=A0ABY6GMI9_9PROT|nr:L-dopachrome tautomerase-related protein [Candidatus Kirkpatrickella diaphorinae]UYH52150.1 major royal jelly family protein [Candidatus Kirkpatrickella diaphorinae]
MKNAASLSHFFKVILLFVVLFCPFRGFAARERPWAPVPHPADVTVIAHLPEGSDWHDVVAVKDGFILQRAPKDGAASLIKVDRAGDAHPFPMAQRDKDGLDAPSALARADDGAIWVVNARPGAQPFLLKLDAETGALQSRIDASPDVYDGTSRFIAIAAHGPMIYLADEGDAALVTYDLEKKIWRRFFAHYPAMLGQRPMNIGGQEVRAADGRPLQRNISHLALQRDGAWLYLQTPTGPLYRLKTELLRDPEFTPVELMESLTEWRRTPTIGGLTIGPDNTLYIIDRSEGRLLSFDAGRNPFMQLADHRFVDAQTPYADPITNEIYVAAGSELLGVTPHRNPQP